MASTQVKASTAPFSPLQYQKPKLQKKNNAFTSPSPFTKQKNLQNNGPKALLLNIA
jgi:hypothetical protein